MLPLLLALLAALPADGKTRKTPEMFIKAGSGAYGTRWRCPAFKAVVDVPPEYDRVPALKNADIAYHFALKHKKAAVEVRLQFAADAETPARAKEREACAASNKETAGSCMMSDLEAPSDAWGQMMAANMNEGRQVAFFPFPADGVKAEFGADWGFVSEPIELDARRGFNKGYAFGQVVVLHRRGVGKLYRIILADSVENMRTLDGPIFYNARFEGAKPPGLVD